MISFGDNFWGEKNNGFFVLMSNMKQGQDSTKEFSDFLRESCSVEESYAKLLTKVAKQAGTCHTNSKGTFGPFWGVLKTLIEKLSIVHMQLVYSWQDLAKDVQRYNDEQHKKLKSVKDSENSTQETVQGLQSTIISLQKAKETYHARRLEYEKVKRENSSLKDIEKVENKYKKAYDDYLSLVDKYANNRSDFDSKMTVSCKRFQEIEENHLEKMKDFVETYVKAWETHHHKIGIIQTEFNISSAEMNVEKLLSVFVESKRTGSEKPGPLQFEEADLSVLPMGTPDAEKKEITTNDKPKKENQEGSTDGSPDSGTSPNKSSSTSTNAPWSLPLRNTGWFSKKKKREKKRKKKDIPNENEEKESTEVDDEGYRIPPENRFNNRDSSTSSDSDSDGEVERGKITVHIKPKDENGSSSEKFQKGDIQELMKQAHGIRLSPVPGRRQTPIQEIVKSSSVSESLSRSADPFDPFSPKSSNDKSIPRSHSPAAVSNPDSSFNSFNMSSGSPDSGGRRTPAFPAPPPSSRTSNRSINSNYSSTARPAAGRTSPAFGAAAVGRTSPAFGLGGGRQSPASHSGERTDSVSSLDRATFNSNPYNSSRGPSPLTIGMSDNIPIAIAFSETVNSLFKGQDLTKCIVKLTGEMMVSFPAGIIRVLMDNPSPTPLTFRLRHAHQLDNILVNKQLVSEDPSQSSTDEWRSYTFIMPALTEHLRKQSAHTKAASYFNIDILKYQVKTSSGAASTPLQLVSYWKCSEGSTDFRLDYQYNASVMKTRLPLHSVTVLLPVNGRVTGMQAQPNAQWSSEAQRAVWKIGEISPMNANGTGSIRAKFDLAEGSTSSPSTAAVQFLCEGSTLSGLDFELTGSGYRVSLIKKRFITGKYISDAEGPS